LFEELIYDGQQLMNGTMLEYRVPRFSDLAGNIKMKLVQNRDGVGPMAPRAAARGAVNPISPCIANALNQATGCADQEAASDSRARLESIAGKEGEES